MTCFFYFPSDNNNKFHAITLCYFHFAFLCCKVLTVFLNSDTNLYRWVLDKPFCYGTLIYNWELIQTGISGLLILNCLWAKTKAKWTFRKKRSCVTWLSNTWLHFPYFFVSCNNDRCLLSQTTEKQIYIQMVVYWYFRGSNTFAL